MYSPCIECMNHYGKQYTKECDQQCEYAHVVSRLKPYGGIDKVIKILENWAFHLFPVHTVDDFVRVVMDKNNKNAYFACSQCGCIFENEDLAYTHETGMCGYCHTMITALWVIQHCHEVSK